MEEMIFAYESKLDDAWKEAFQSGSFDKISVPIDYQGNEISKLEAKLFRWEDGPNHTYKCDYEGMRAVEARIQNGFRLFGRYYQNLWDWVDCNGAAIVWTDSCSHEAFQSL